MSTFGSRAVLAVGLGLVLACQPGSIGEARDQLAREADGVLQLRLPLADTTYLIAALLKDQDTLTTPDGLLGVRIQADTLDAVTYAQFLATEQITSSINVSLLTGAAGAGAAVMATDVDTLRFVTAQGSDVIGGAIDAGYAVRSVTNNTGCMGSADMVVHDAQGSLLVTFPTAVVADGATYVDSVSLGGTAVNGFAVLTVDAATLGSCVPAPGASVSSVVTVRPLTLQSVTLDNVSESISVEQFEEVDASQVDFDDLEDAIRQSTLHSAFITVNVTNSAGLPLVADGLTLGAVPLDGSGQPMRNGSGGPLYEESTPGNPILVTLADPGQTTLTVGRQSSVVLMINAAPLVDRVVDMILDGDRVALAIAGTALGGDGSVSTLTDQDVVRLDYELTVGLDVTIPLSGVVFTRNQTVGGVSLDGEDARDIAQRLVSVAVAADVQNTTPFGVELDIALAPDSLGDSVDIFSLPNAVLLNTVSLTAPAVDGTGFSTGPVTDTATLGIAGTDSEVVLGDTFTAGIRVRMVPGAGGNGRGAVRPTDGVAVDASVEVAIRRGNQ
jgi:hypothetical protein